VRSEPYPLRLAQRPGVLAFRFRARNERARAPCRRRLLRTINCHQATEGGGRVLENEPFLASKNWNAVYARSSCERSLEVYSRSVRRPRQQARWPACSVLRQNRPISVSRVHHRDLGLIVDHRQERQCFFRPAKYGEPVRSRDRQATSRTRMAAPEHAGSEP